MGTFCSCCYIGKTSTMIETIRALRYQMESEEMMTDVSDMPEPMKKTSPRKKTNKKRKYHDIIRNKIVAF